jgi:predicted RNA binding protein YcfA (HicA-like mRNA interferase family)
MGPAEKLLERMRNNPRDWRIEDLLALAARLGIQARRPGGSHVIFSFPGGLGEATVPAHRPIKPIYIKKLLALVQAMLEEE